MRILVLAKGLVKLLQHVEGVVSVFSDLLTSLGCKFGIDVLEVVSQVEIREVAAVAIRLV